MTKRGLKPSGLARSTIGRGLKDLDAAPLPKGRERRKGGGRRHLSSRDATLIEDLRGVIEPATLGDPMRPLLWVSKSHDKVAAALQKQGHEISASSVKRLLPTLGYSRQSNRKADEGSKHPDRNAQFEYINAKAIAAQAAGQPVIAGIKFKRGQFPSSVLTQTAGHLIVIRGFKENGDVICNDPANKTRGNGVVYKADELGKAWFGCGGVGYIIRKPVSPSTMPTVMR